MTILIILLAKSLHGPLLWNGVPCGLAVIMRSQVGLGELGSLWPRAILSVNDRSQRTGADILRHIDDSKNEQR